MQSGKDGRQSFLRKQQSNYVCTIGVAFHAMQSMPGEGKVYSKKRPEKKHFFLAFIAYLQNDLLKIQTKYKKAPT